MDLTNLSANWKRLQSTTPVFSSNSDTKSHLKRKRSSPNISRYALKRRTLDHSSARLPPPQASTKAAEMEGFVERPLTSKKSGRVDVEIGKYISLDCEMVGVGPRGAESALARVSIVNYNGDQVYDSFVKPKEEVTDWRTPVSGIRPSYLNNAKSFEQVQVEVAEILRDRIIIGHALRHDFKALLLDHPLRDIRDTSRFAPYKKLSGGTPKLQLLASQLLGLEIQTGEHSSLEDARACMLLYRRDKEMFESKTKMKKRHK